MIVQRGARRAADDTVRIVRLTPICVRESARRGSDLNTEFRLTAVNRSTEEKG